MEHDKRQSSCGMEDCRYHFWEEKPVPFQGMVNHIFDALMAMWSREELKVMWDLHRRL